MNIQEHANLTRELVDVAMGRKPADLVVRNGRWVNVQSGEILGNTDVAITHRRIAYVGPDASHCIGNNTQIIQADNRYLVPGLLDAHMHVESGMLTVTEFVRAVIPHGTTGMFIDPHEIANVFGLPGVKLMVDEASIQPIHVWVQMPSCVPSAPGLETPGASIGTQEVEQAMQWDGIIGLGEMMNFPGVFNSDKKMHAEMAATRKAGKVIGGHYASPDLDLPLHGYIAGGPQDDHEGTRMEDAIARIRQGMKVMLRFGSAWHDVAEGVRAITEMGIDSRHFLLCTDDSHSATLVRDGHVNRALRQAISHGVPPITAIQMATINTAEHFGVSQDVGMIAPGRYADLLFVNNLAELDIETVIIKGVVAAKNGHMLLDLPSFTYPEWVIHSVNIGKPKKVIDFQLTLPEHLNKDASHLTANVIGIVENQAPTRHLRLVVPVVKGQVHADLDKDLAKVALVERHQGTGRTQIGLISGFGLNTQCAIASTVAHDSHHLIVIGTSDDDMAIAVNELARMDGGQVVVHRGQVIGSVNLPIAGLMSNERAEVVANKAESILEGFRTCGCKLNNPNMQLSLLALVVIPELRISDLGLVDVTRFDFIPTFELD